MTTNGTRTWKSIAVRHAPRILLGLVFAVSGLNKLLHFIPLPPPPPSGLAFMGALVGTGYLLQLVAATEIAAGVLLLTNRFVPLALALLAPVLVNIVAFHAFLAPAGLGLPLVLLAAELALAWQHRAEFAPMLHARAVTAGPEATRAAPPTPLRAAA
jgi:putative oxidoreductase